MPEQNTEIVRRSYEAFARGDLAGMLEEFDPQMVAYRDFPDGATFHRREGLMELIADWVKEFDDYTITPQEFVDVNDHQVIVRVRQKAVGKLSGVPTEGDFWFVHTLRAGKVTRLDMLRSKAAALERARLSE